MKESQTESTVVIPAKSVVKTDASGTVSITVEKETTLKTETKTAEILGPKSFAPPAPASQIEIARGQAVLWSYGLAGLLLLVGLGMLYLQHYKAGGSLLIGAVLVPIASSLLTSTLALTIGAVFLAIGLTLYAAWHLMQKRVAVP